MGLDDLTRVRTNWFLVENDPLPASFIPSISSVFDWWSSSPLAAANGRARRLWLRYPSRVGTIANGHCRAVILPLSGRSHYSLFPETSDSTTLKLLVGASSVAGHSVAGFLRKTDHGVFGDS